MTTELKSQRRLGPRLEQIRTLSVSMKTGSELHQTCCFSLFKGFLITLKSKNWSKISASFNSRKWSTLISYWKLTRAESLAYVLTPQSGKRKSSCFANSLKLATRTRSVNLYCRHQLLWKHNTKRSPKQCRKRTRVTLGVICRPKLQRRSLPKPSKCVTNFRRQSSSAALKLNQEYWSSKTRLKTHLLITASYLTTSTQLWSTTGVRSPVITILSSMIKRTRSGGASTTTPSVLK